MGLGRIAAILLLALMPGGLAAQGDAPLAPPDGGASTSVMSPVLIVDPDRLFSGSDLGRKLNASLDASARALAAENREIELQLEAEERDLAEQRASLTPEEFRTLADDFDRRVSELRDTQAQKAQLLDRQRNENRLRFLQLVAPLLAQMMRDAGAVVILNRGDVFLSASSIDITDAAIARINADLTIETADDIDDLLVADPADPDVPAGDAPALVPDPAN